MPTATTPSVVGKHGNTCFAKEPNGDIKITRFRRSGIQDRHHESDPLILPAAEAQALAAFIDSHRVEYSA